MGRNRNSKSSTANRAPSEPTKNHSSASSTENRTSASSTVNRTSASSNGAPASSNRAPASSTVNRAPALSTLNRTSSSSTEYRPSASSRVNRSCSESTENRASASFTGNHASSESTENLASDDETICNALLITTMYIIGCHVDVLIRDGSVYSGIFHTASVDGNYDIILKKARMTKEGKGLTDKGKDGRVIETLVIRSADYVEIVAKDVLFPSASAGRNVTGADEEAVAHNVSHSESSACEVDNPTALLMDAKEVNQSRQAADDKSKGKAEDCRQKSDFVSEKNDEKIESLNSSHEIKRVEAVDHQSADMKSSPFDNGLICNNAPASVKANDRCSERSTVADSASTNPPKGVNIIPESHNLAAKPVEISVPRVTGSSRNAKEFKLNPAAKIFSPSFVNPEPAAVPSPTAANMVYIPNSTPMVPLATIQPEIGFNTFVSRPSAPVKVSQYSNLTVGNGGSGSQFSQPIVGQLAHRTQPLRYAAHYAPVLSEPAYLQPSSPVMVGRSGQLVYVQPVSHDLIHGATGISPVSARPLLNHAQFPKQQGGTVGQAMPVCVPPPVLTNAQQPFGLQSHHPLLQPGFPVTRPISVPGSNGFYGTKFS